uniref:Uncharacterized protein n=1 Tax=Amorphochlora amoebiformis TaxID=1561963 RepID=A0A7S0DNS9_9EUKA
MRLKIGSESTACTGLITKLFRTLRMPDTFLSLKGTKSAFSAVGDIEEAIVILMLLIDLGHHSTSGREGIVYKDEDGFLRRQLNALSDHINELADGEIRRDQVLLLVNVDNIALFGLFTDNGNSIRIFGSDLVRFSFALL